MNKETINIKWEDERTEVEEMKIREIKERKAKATRELRGMLEMMLKNTVDFNIVIDADMFDISEIAEFCKENKLRFVLSHRGDFAIVKIKRFD